MRSDAARNRLRILDVARELVGADGPAVSMDDIARKVGVAVGTLYRHFPTKAALVEAVVQDSVTQLADAVDAARARVAHGAPAGDELAALFRAVAQRHSADAAVKEAAISLGALAPGADGVTDFAAHSPELRAWQSIVGLLDAAIAEGSVRSDLTAADLLALVGGVPRDPVSADIRDRYVDIVLVGIAATAASTKT